MYIYIVSGKTRCRYILPIALLKGTIFFWCIKLYPPSLAVFWTRTTLSTEFFPRVNIWIGTGFSTAPSWEWHEDYTSPHSRSYRLHFRNILADCEFSDDCYLFRVFTSDLLLRDGAVTDYPRFTSTLRSTTTLFLPATANFYLWPWPLNDVDRVELNHRRFVRMFLPGHTNTQPTDCSNWTTSSSIRQTEMATLGYTPCEPNNNSSGDEIANVNFSTRHRTCRGQRLRPLNGLPNFYYKYLCYRPNLCT